MLCVGAVPGVGVRNQRVNACVVGLGASLGWLAGTFAVFALVPQFDMLGPFSSVMQFVTGWIVAVIALMLADKVVSAA